MNVEIGTEAAQFPEKEYINGIFLAVWRGLQTDVLMSVTSRTWGPWVRAVSARSRPSETSPGTPAPLGCNNSTLFQYTRHDKLVCKDGLIIFKNVFLKMLFAVRGVAFCNWYSTPLAFFLRWRKVSFCYFAIVIYMCIRSLIVSFPCSTKLVHS